MDSRDRPADGFVECSASMIEAGIRALREETFHTPHDEVVSLVYMAMEYQRIRDAASRTISSK